MLAYYVLYKVEISQGPPAGIIVLETRHGDAMLWNHLAKAWQYDPATAQRILANPENMDRYQNVDRATAEQVTLVVTKGHAPLPDETTIRWIFDRKGIPQEDDEE